MAARATPPRRSERQAVIMEGLDMRSPCAGTRRGGVWPW
jgi:hypothetical protein